MMRFVATKDGAARRRRREPLAALLLGILSTGCTSAYMPRPSPQISLVVESGRVTYVRDGRKYAGGLFGGDLDEAVRGNPRAEEYASEYKSGMAAGFSLTMLGVVGLIGGLSLTATETAQQPSDQRSAPVAGLVTLAGGLVAYVAGLTMALNAQPHLYDAINTYNDGVSGHGDTSSAPVPAAAR